MHLHENKGHEWVVLLITVSVPFYDLTPGRSIPPEFFAVKTFFLIFLTVYYEFGEEGASRLVRHRYFMNVLWDVDGDWDGRFGSHDQGDTPLCRCH